MLPDWYMWNNFFKNSKPAAGFTLVEVMAATFIAVTGIAAAYGLVNYSLAMANDASMRLTASYLAKEGIEIIRNIRDSNYVERENSWNYKLENCYAGCGVDYSSDSLSPDYKDDFLKLDGGFYKYSPSGESTPYKRIVTVDDSFADILKLTVEVKWSRSGKQNSVVLREDIYNWWKF